MSVRTFAVDVNGTTIENNTYSLGTLLTPDHLCPDLLRYENIGEADGWRGRVVRWFFYLMQAWPIAKDRL